MFPSKGGLSSAQEQAWAGRTQVIAGNQSSYISSCLSAPVPLWEIYYKRKDG